MPKRGSSTVIGGGKRRRARPQEFPKEKAETEDRLSELPDCLLLLILSFLPTKEVVKTCLLSKRWRFLWTYMSEVNLVEDNWNDADTRRFVDCVGRMLVMHRGIYLKKFAVSFYYDEIFASNVDTWVHFAIKNKVKDITLRCLLENLYFFASNSFEFLYKLPQMLYSNSSLTGLTIYSCDVAPQTVVAWGSLKSLSIGGVTLQDNIMENILSGCPVLEVLCLTEFRGLNCLNICSQNLKKLVIEHWNGSLLEISAPYVLDLSISIDISDEPGNFRLKNISSVVRAKLYFEHSGFFKDHDDPRSSMNYMKELLESIKNAEELELGPWCIEVLSVMEAKGFKLPQSTRSCLTLNPWSVKEAVPGILGILKSSPDLTTLVVEGRYVHAYVPLDGVAKYLHNNDFDLDAFHLKSVKINNFIDDDLPGEPMLTMARILLKSSRVLEKMVISTKKLIDFSSYEGSCNLAEIAIKLLTFPRASPEAVVMVEN